VLPTLVTKIKICNRHKLGAFLSHSIRYFRDHLSSFENHNQKGFEDHFILLSHCMSDLHQVIITSSVTVGTKEVEAHLTGLSKVAGENSSPITNLGAAYFSDKN
jgi:hypothetical protein